MRAQAEALSVEAFDILRAAVTLSKTGRYLRLLPLVEELRRRFPGQEADVEEAIAFWKQYPPSLES